MMSDEEVPSGFVPPAIEDLNQWLPSYEIIDLIACGGMGAVYRARQISLDRLVAIKILPPELAVDESFRGSFEAEGKSMAKLSHSNLVGVYDFGEISDMLYLVMEFVEGSDLYASKGDAAIDPEVAVKLIRSVASGLAEAHRMDLVHRDIKPANILITTELVPKLGDFGLAVPDSDIESGLMMGTPAYLSPEVLADPSCASFASDTYALGVILYEMLTGSSIEQGDVMDLNRVPALGDLPKIVSKAVDPKPLLRYQNGETLEAALRDWTQGPKSVLAVSPGGPPIQAKVTPTVEQSSGGGGGLLLGLLGLVVAGGLAWVFLGKGEEEGGESDDLTNSPEDVGIEEAGEMAAKEDGSAVLEELRLEQKKTLEGLGQRFAETRLKNRRDFIEVAGAEGEELLQKVPKVVAGLPQYFHPSEVEISEALMANLREFVGFRQRDLDRKFRREVVSSHRDSLRALRKEGAEFPEEIGDSWEAWASWLGLNPAEVMPVSLAGVWRASGNSGDFALHVSSTGKKVLMAGDVSVEDADLLELSNTGEVILKYAGDPAFRSPWKLRNFGDRMEGEDSDGVARVLRLENYDFSEIVKAANELKPPSEKMAQEGTKKEEAFETFEDPQVASLTEKYRQALVDKIEPLETGYSGVLTGFLESYQKRGDASAVEQIKKELIRLKGLSWRRGFVELEGLPRPGELPSDVGRKLEVFQSEFKRRYEPLRTTYRNSLRTMLRNRKGQGLRNLADLEKALQQLDTPEGMVRARYVKLVSLPDQSNEHVTITLFEVYDSDGKVLSNRKFSDVEVSSFETNDFTRSCPGESALDGNPQTYWHTKWRDPAGTFPHWISFDLGTEQLISGFQIKSREFHKERLTDVTRWTFSVSLDRQEWTQVAEGNFPKGDQANKHLGFKVSE